VRLTNAESDVRFSYRMLAIPGKHGFMLLTSNVDGFCLQVLSNMSVSEVVNAGPQAAPRTQAEQARMAALRAQLLLQMLQRLQSRLEGGATAEELYNEAERNNQMASAIEAEAAYAAVFEDAAAAAAAMQLADAQLMQQ
jgi:hypothetical protein